MRHATRPIAFLAAALLTAAAKPTSDATFMLPAAIILRGGGLKAPVAFNHAGGGVNITGDTIAILYALTPYAPKSAERVRQRQFIEVVEFFGSSFVPYVSGTPSIDRADHFSRIYLPGGGEPALWNNPVVAPAGSGGERVFYRLSDLAIQMLAARGVKLE
ncbi:MAG TPA: hypothetical protein VHV78_05120 [Gemmatimonadaceae bacterium]|nr:hypothetical protein [Gemmatimonadaceae bacterium]